MLKVVALLGFYSALVAVLRRFETALKIRPIGCPETSLNKNHHGVKPQLHGCL
jgi:hypothetical protein